MKINCPHCNQEYDVGEKYIGQEGQCSECGASFIAKSHFVKCKFCLKLIHEDAQKCSFCQSWQKPRCLIAKGFARFFAFLLILGITNFITAMLMCISDSHLDPVKNYEIAYTYDDLKNNYQAISHIAYYNIYKNYRFWCNAISEIINLQTLCILPCLVFFCIFNVYLKKHDVKYLSRRAEFITIAIFVAYSLLISTMHHLAQERNLSSYKALLKYEISKDQIAMQYVDMFFENTKGASIYKKNELFDKMRKEH